jgi:hypothetical protein
MHENIILCGIFAQCAAAHDQLWLWSSIMPSNILLLLLC